MPPILPRMPLEEELEEGEEFVLLCTYMWGTLGKENEPQNRISFL